jgi:hypothetical protein
MRSRIRILRRLLVLSSNSTVEKKVLKADFTSKLGLLRRNALGSRWNGFSDAYRDTPHCCMPELWR